MSQTASDSVENRLIGRIATLTELLEEAVLVVEGLSLQHEHRPSEASPGECNACWDAWPCWTVRVRATLDPMKVRDSR